MTLLTTIPFSGFYETHHSDALDEALEYLFQDGDDEIPTKLQKAYEALNWRQAQTQYAKVYTQALKTLSGLDFKFESITYPREYNFESETLFAFITPDSVQKIFDETDTPGLRTLARERFTSRAGFASFYDPDIDTWPQDPTTWDHNQLGCLLQAWLDQEHFSPESGRFCQWAEWSELEVMEHARCNGVLENIVWNALPPDLRTL